MITQDWRIWFVAKIGKEGTQGPFTIKEIHQRYIDKQIGNTHRVSKDGELWEVIHAVPELVPEELLHLSRDLVDFKLERVES